MTSTFGWLDTDESQRKKVLEIIELFKDAGTVDELGIGSIRDTFANALFPGTSVLHTRLRYTLFIPWLLQRAATRSNPESMSTAMRKHEIDLIYALLKNEQTGIIGQQAKTNLKQLPSAMYWAQLAAWGIRTSPDGGQVSRAAFFRHAHSVRSLNARMPAADDLEARDQPLRLLLDPELPPSPPRVLSDTTFDLTVEEEEYLSAKIASSTEGSLLSWLITHPPARQVDLVWELDRVDIDAFPTSAQRLIEHGRRFHTANHGAALVYNLLLAEKSRQAEGVEKYREGLELWRDELESTGALVDWNRTDFWATLGEQNRRLSPITKRFVDEWINIVTDTVNVADSQRARKLIDHRERQVKGGRARLANSAALDDWRGESGLGRLDYRWKIAQRLLGDLYSARGLEQAA